MRQKSKEVAFFRWRSLARLLSQACHVPKDNQRERKEGPVKVKKIGQVPGGQNESMAERSELNNGKEATCSLDLKTQKKMLTFLNGCTPK